MQIAGNQNDSVTIALQKYNGADNINIVREST